MAFLTPNKERDRYYLLPGMGGRALRQKRIASLIWAVIVGALLSAGVAALLFLMNNLPPASL
jgi:hypothetical protein